MGNTQSPSTNPQFDLATRAFTQKELEDLNLLFVSLAAQSQSSGRYVSPSAFEAYYGLHGLLGQRVFDLVTQNRKDQRLTFEDIVIAKGTYEKGTKDEIEEFIYQILDVTSDGIMARSDLEAVLTTMLDDIFSSEHGSSSHQEVMDIFINAATFSKHHNECAEKCMSFEDFRSWCALLPSVRKFLGSLLMPSDMRRPGSQVPRLLHIENSDSNMVILRKEYAWLIAGSLSLQELEEWKLIYHSALNGLSFTTFLGNISNDVGPTVLVIKDKEGCIYGGYASQPWERHSDFYGDMKCFLFQLYPKASIFRPTGANANIQWCAVNFSSENIPNGIGFGGRVSHFGLFLSASFDQGHTFTCTTFGSPCLSKSNMIYPEVIECWRIVSKGAQDEKNSNAGKGSVLERFKEDRHMLNMVGLANSSD